MDMMYMPDGLRAAIEILEANPEKLIHRNSFNIASMSFDPEIIYNNIKKYMPDFHIFIITYIPNFIIIIKSEHNIIFISIKVSFNISCS